MSGEWIRKPRSNNATVVFVHGILSGGETCWRHENGTYWPELLQDEPKFESLGIYVYSYRTGFSSGSYSLSDVVDDFKEHLITLDNVVNSHAIIFVCHSMGGIVVRKFVVERRDDLIDRDISVGLYLVASPSLGSDYANWLEPVAKFAGHSQARALRFSQDNQWLNDLDKTFMNLKESGRITIYGKELLEDTFITLKTFWRKQIVQPFSGSRYFGESIKIAGADHFSIAKPENGSAKQHRLLKSFLDEHFVANSAKSVDSPDGAPVLEINPSKQSLVMEHGSMASDSRFYITRQSDAEMEKYLTQSGRTIIVKGARQMGKSSLLVRAAKQAMTKDGMVCYIDFQRMDEEQLSSLNSLLLYLMNRLAIDTKTTRLPDDYWNSYLGAKDRATDFVEKAILPNNSQQVFLFLDEVDRVFNYPYRNDFFSLLRFWTNRRATTQSWNRFNLVLAHSTDPLLWIDDINQSPFNVGTPITLHSFDRDQMTELANRYKLSLSDSELESIQSLIDGQPYLVRQSFYLLATQAITMQQLEDQAIRQDGPFSDHLRRLSSLLSQTESLKQAVQQIQDTNSCEDEHSFQRLSAAGLVTGASRQQAQLRCQLYQDYFRDTL